MSAAPGEEVSRYVQNKGGVPASQKLTIVLGGILGAIIIWTIWTTGAAEGFSSSSTSSRVTSSSTVSELNVKITGVFSHWRSVNFYQRGRRGINELLTPHHQLKGGRFWSHSSITVQRPARLKLCICGAVPRKKWLNTRRSISERCAGCEGKTNNTNMFHLAETAEVVRSESVKGVEEEREHLAEQRKKVALAVLPIPINGFIRARRGIDAIAGGLKLSAVSLGKVPHSSYRHRHTSSTIVAELTEQIVSIDAKLMKDGSSCQIADNQLEVGRKREESEE
ncbi:hypothetical protein JOM56_010868 [Amanita muscaria]